MSELLQYANGNLPRSEEEKEIILELWIMVRL